MRLLPIFFLACFLAGCGAFQPSECEPAPAAPAAPAPAEPSPRKPSFVFGLPEGDRSPNQLIESAAYEEMSKKRCKNAQAMMQRKTSTESDRGWGDFQEPREVLLYQAGLELCLGNESQARKWFDLVSKNYGGWAGIGWDPDTTTVLRWHVCEMYRNVASVVKQLPEKGFKCARYGDKPDFILEWQTNGQPDPRK